MEVILEENLAERAAKLGEVFRRELTQMNSPIVELVRGKGLLNAAVIKPHERHGEKFTAKEVCYEMAEHGLLAKQTHQHIIRFAPPLVITESELEKGISIIRNAFALA